MQLVPHTKWEERQKIQGEWSFNSRETAKHTRAKQEENKCRIQEKSATIRKNQWWQNSVEKSSQIIPEESIIFKNMKAIISDSFNIFDSIIQKMIDLT